MASEATKISVGGYTCGRGAGEEALLRLEGLVQILHHLCRTGTCVLETFCGDKFEALAHRLRDSQDDESLLRLTIRKSSPTWVLGRAALAWATSSD